jgi:hypothetical protein
MTWNKATELLVEYDHKKQKFILRYITPNYLAQHRDFFLDATAQRYTFFSQLGILCIVDARVAANVLAKKIVQRVENIIKIGGEGTRVGLVYDGRTLNTHKVGEKHRRELSKPILTQVEIADAIKPLLDLGLSSTNYEEEREKVEKHLKNRCSPNLLGRDVQFLTAKILAAKFPGTAIQIEAAEEAEATLALLQRKHASVVAVTNDGDYVNYGGTEQVVDISTAKSQLAGTFRPVAAAVHDISFMCKLFGEKGVIANFAPHSEIVLAVIHVCASSDFFSLGPGSAKSARGIHNVGNVTAVNILYAEKERVILCKDSTEALAFCSYLVFHSKEWTNAITAVGLSSVEIMKKEKEFKNAVLYFFLGAAVDFTSCGNAGSVIDQIFTGTAIPCVVHVNPTPSIASDRSLTIPKTSKEHEFRISMHNNNNQLRQTTYNKDMLNDPVLQQKYNEWYPYCDFSEIDEQQRVLVYYLAEIKDLRHIASLYGVQCQADIRRAQVVGMIKAHVLSGHVPKRSWDHGRSYRERRFNRDSVVAQGIKNDDEDEDDNDCPTILSYLHDRGFGQDENLELAPIFYRGTVMDSYDKVALSVTETRRALNLVFGHFDVAKMTIFEQELADSTTVIIYIKDVVASYAIKKYDVHLFFETPKDGLLLDGPFYRSSLSTCSCVAGVGNCSHKSAALMFVGLLIKSWDYTNDETEILERLPALIKLEMKQVQRLDEYFSTTASGEGNNADDEDVDGSLEDAASAEEAEEEHVSEQNSTQQSPSDNESDSHESDSHDSDNLQESENDSSEQEQYGSDDGSVVSHISLISDFDASYLLSPKPVQSQGTEQEYLCGNLLEKIVGIVWEGQSLPGFPSINHQCDAELDKTEAADIQDWKEVQANASKFFDLLRKCEGV